MYTKVEWQSAYAINHPKVDRQHQGLFKLIDEIPDYLDADKIQESIMKLYEYTGAHFSDEELMMKKMDYPDLKEHQKIHYDLVSKLADFSKHRFTDLVMLDEFKDFTYNWLVEHILREDMKYKSFAEENDVSW